MDLKTYAQVKRFLERYLADPNFRKIFKVSHEEALKEVNISIPYETIRDTLTDFYNKTKNSEYYRVLDKIQKIQNSVWNNFSVKPIPYYPFECWRQFHLNRIKKIFSKNTVHQKGNLLIAYELSEGCSGHCPFCCLDPPPLQRIFEFNDKNKKLWEKILNINLEVLGEHVKYSICYFATEPFDNPFYENFAEIYKEINGLLPQVTTIKHLKEKERIKKYIKKYKKEIEKIPVRFSVISLNMLKKIHEAYSPEELVNVYLLLLNIESPYKYSLSGRAIRYFNSLKSKMKSKDLYKKFSKKDSSVCISGFVVNMVKKEIKLIVPTIPNKKYPYGYIEFGNTHFRDEIEYKDKLFYLMEKVSSKINNKLKYGVTHL